MDDDNGFKDRGGDDDERGEGGETNLHSCFYVLLNVVACFVKWFARNKTIHTTDFTSPRVLHSNMDRPRTCVALFYLDHHSSLPTAADADTQYRTVEACAVSLIERKLLLKIFDFSGFSPNDSLSCLF